MNITEVNFKPLFQWINKNLGTNAHFQISFEGKRPTIVCGNNLYNESAIFKAVIQEVKVDFFNFSYDETTGKLWATISLNYESWSGGSNGMQIGMCWFNPEEGWTFESCKERFEKNNQ